MRKVFLLATVQMIAYCALAQVPKHSTSYNCFKTTHNVVIDGNLTDEEWGKVEWMDTFADIEGEKMPKPFFATRAKMMWDDKYFYIAAELKDNHLWADITARDAVIFHNNDFEVFIDPQGDNHHYMEIEINALNTVWDLMLPKPYKNGGNAVDSWDIVGMKSAVKIYGTLNDPSDIDSMWTVEIALPWSALGEMAFHEGAPHDKEVWRLSFSRVHWNWELDNGKYKRKIDEKTGKLLPEYNWTSSAQSAIAMHQPESWGYVQFHDSTVGTKGIPTYIDPDFALKIKLVEWNDLLLGVGLNNTKAFKKAIASLPKDVLVETTSLGWLISVKGTRKRWSIDHEGKVLPIP
ncbi:MAG: carbohydrate-binding family 9-like protein [Bacteroidales bacterium]